MKIAVDAMGGDFAPRTNVEGAFWAAKKQGARVVLVGDEDQVSKELSRYPTSKLPIYVHHAPHVVAMHDSPSAVVRVKGRSWRRRLGPKQDSGKSTSPG